MSGNPFRASLHQHHSAGSSAAPFSFIDTDSNRADEPSQEYDSVHASPPPVKTKKSVRIESPTSSVPHPDLFNADDALSPRPDQAKHADSPLSTAPREHSSLPISQAVYDPSERNFTSREDAYGVEGTSGSARSNPDMMETAKLPVGAPPNPFSRTLATIEPQEKGRGELEHTTGQSRAADRPALEKPGSAAAKALDVESFKRLLMTGISPPGSTNTSQAVLATAPALVPPPILESGSSTDTSSVSRQSIFEPVQEPLVETPRTSYEMPASEDEEMQALVGASKKVDKKKPPPAPKHRHGKLVNARTPQTVSFSDFSPSVIAQDAQPVSSPKPLNRTDSNLNKPLPAPPTLGAPAHISSQLEDLPTLETTTIQADPTFPQKKQPPPVPLARRKSQLRSSGTTTRSRSNSSLTMSSQHSVDYLTLSPGIVNNATLQMQGHKSPPPPPPSRRHHGVALGIGPSSANSSATELPSSPSPGRRSDVSSPDPPSSRRPTLPSAPSSSAPGTDLARTTSTSSNRNPRSVSNESTSMAPPPPPPRRRQSGRTSLDKERPPYPPTGSSPTESRRTSSENKRSSIEGKRRTSVASESSLRYEYAPTTEQEQPLYSPREELVEEPGELKHTTTNTSTILDDMDKFQREIDELRQKYKQTS